LFKVVSDTPGYLLLACGLVAVVLTFLLYRKSKKNEDLNKRVVFLMAALRFVGVFFLCILLCKIFIKSTLNKTEYPLLLVAIDNSSSMAKNNGESLGNADITLIKDELLSGINKEFQTKFISFGSKVKINDSIDFSEKETSLSELFDYLELNFENRNTGALVLISDGIINKGANPVYKSSKLRYPVYSIAMGDTSIKKDIFITKVNHNQNTYLGNRFPVEVTIGAHQFNGRESTLSISKNGVKKTEQKFRINSDNYSGSYQFVLEAETPGLHRYEIHIQELEGEQSKLNNRQSFVIDVIDNREKILFLYHAPHPDVAAISESLESLKNYELLKSPISQFQSGVKPYSLLIIHGYQNISDQKIIEDCLSASVPFLIVNPSSANNLPIVKINSAINKYNDTEPILQPAFVYFTISDELKNMVKKFPAVKTFFGQYSMANGSQVLLTQKIGSVETGDPILVYQEINNLKSGLFIGDGLWRWKMINYLEKENFNAFNELISKSVQYLSVKSDKSFFRVYGEKIINQNENLEFTSEVYNKSYELITEPEVALVLKNQDGQSFNYFFTKQNSNYKLNAGIHEPGEYSYEAKVKINNEVMVKKGVVIIKEMLSEKMNTVANHKLLNDISIGSNGKLFYPQEIKKLINEINNNEYIKPITYSENTTSDLIDLKWLFILLVIIFSAEWFLRKVSGII